MGRDGQWWINMENRYGMSDNVLLWTWKAKKEKGMVGVSVEVWQCDISL